MFRDRLLWSAVAFAAGVALLQQISSLPSAYYCLLFPFIFAVCWWQPKFTVIGALLLGMLWALLWAQMRLAHALPEALIGKDLQVIGTVVSIPESDDRRTSFEFKIEQQQKTAAGELRLPLKVRLSWYRQANIAIPDITVGQQWNLLLRLKPPIGFMNPGGFDYEAWLFSHNIRAVGYVRGQGDNHLLTQKTFRYAISILRSRLLDKLSDLSENLQHRGILLALALGYRDAIDERDWDLLLRTGTNHLMAISGLHIGLTAGLLYFLILWCVGFAHKRAWLRQGLWPAQRIAAIAAWMGALVYASLAGFSLPTQRAMLMLTVGLYAVVAYRQLRPAQALSLALIAVLIVDPFAVQAAGFWLSFAAVAVLVYCYAGRKAANLPRWLSRLWNWGKVQAVLLIGLLPLTLYWFGAAAVSASAANLIAIPLVGLVVVPFVLLASLLAVVWAPLAQWLLQLADGLLNLLWPLLEFMQHLPLSRWVQPQPPLWTVLLALAGAGLLLAPRGFPSRWVGLFWFAPMLFYSPFRPQSGEFLLTALDVGQGTAIVIQTSRHNLIYDTGPRLNDRFDTGKLVVLPYLKASGISKADILLVSHGDNDHSGGSAAILDALRVDKLISSAPVTDFLSVTDIGSELSVESCSDGQSWVWDGVHFSILHPDRTTQWDSNNSSCVLLVETGGRRVLLTGDIEKRAERHLLREHHVKPVSILFAPHHGSNSSSQPAFVEALYPQHVIFNAGLLNSYGFPRPEVVERYSKTHAQLRTTGEQGAMEFMVGPFGVELKRSYRHTARRYWHYQPL
ncbi:MAG: DNA internalization-related competence protein ComEC/Rec2 [Gammaproteobacteria bacterium]|nr:DNA internalization-related competence protein ComEC/Rec2 [Gammaproteobacteria bacterium]